MKKLQNKNKIRDDVYALHTMQSKAFYAKHLKQYGVSED